MIQSIKSQCNSQFDSCLYNNLNTTTRPDAISTILTYILSIRGGLDPASYPVQMAGHGPYLKN